MNTNTRFAVAVHMLAFLATNTRWPNTSDFIALSVNTNAVVIRRLVGCLKKAGLVRVLPKAGGTVLARPAEKISLLDVYLAVNPADECVLINMHKNPNLSCPVGLCIHDALAGPVQKARTAFAESLSSTSLADIAANITARYAQKV